MEINEVMTEFSFHLTSSKIVALSIIGKLNNRQKHSTLKLNICVILAALVLEITESKF